MFGKKYGRLNGSKLKDMDFDAFVILPLWNRTWIKQKAGRKGRAWGVLACERKVAKN